MARIHEVKGYAVVLDKIVHVTRVFEAKNGEGAQFNVQLVGNAKLLLKFPDRATATLERDLLIKALKEY
ncbi:MAG: hypothetical protein AB8B96_14050 [Lysobacterales bacterium]